MIRLRKSQIYKVLNKISTNKTNMSLICDNSVDIYIVYIY